LIDAVKSVKVILETDRLDEEDEVILGKIWNKEEKIEIIDLNFKKKVEFFNQEIKLQNKEKFLNKFTGPDFKLQKDVF